MDMETNTSDTQEQLTADQQDAFLEGWSEDEVTETETTDETTAHQREDAPVEAPEEETAQDGAEAPEETAQEQADTTAGEGGEDAAGVEGEQEQPADPQWVVKHMGEAKVLSAGDITPELLQKGMDYDRIRTKYDEAKPVMEMFSQFAANAGMSTADYAKHIRTQAKRASGMDEAAARQAVELEDRAAAVAAKEQELTAKESGKEAQQAKIQADLADFQRAFPEVFKLAKTEPGAIPRSVWDAVHQGMSLTAAYSKYVVDKANEAVKAAQETAQAATQSRKNAVRSTGSMKSAGSDSKTSDPFLDAFLN